jgi:hypothetical protein
MSYAGAGHQYQATILTLLSRVNIETPSTSDGIDYRGRQRSITGYKPALVDTRVLESLSQR